MISVEYNFQLYCVFFFLFWGRYLSSPSDSALHCCIWFVFLCVQLNAIDLVPIAGDLSQQHFCPAVSPQSRLNSKYNLKTSTIQIIIVMKSTISGNKLQWSIRVRVAFFASNIRKMVHLHGGANFIGVEHWLWLWYVMLFRFAQFNLFAFARYLCVSLAAQRHNLIKTSLKKRENQYSLKMEMFNIQWKNLPYCRDIEPFSWVPPSAQPVCIPWSRCCCRRMNIVKWCDS